MRKRSRRGSDTELVLGTTTGIREQQKNGGIDIGSIQMPLGASAPISLHHHHQLKERAINSTASMDLGPSSNHLPISSSSLRADPLHLWPQPNGKLHARSQLLEQFIQIASSNPLAIQLILQQQRDHSSKFPELSASAPMSSSLF
jgi:hypothetical protein